MELGRLKEEGTLTTKKLIFYCNEMTSVAHALANSPSAHDMLFGKIRWNSFEDGLPDLHIENAEAIAGADVTFLAHFTPANLFGQIAAIYAIPRHRARSFKLILPYFPPGTKERVIEYGDIATAKTLARMLSAIPLSQNGPTEIVMFDIHALSEQFYFEDTVLPRLESAMRLFKLRLHTLPDRNNIAIAFPDEGARKRFGRQFTEFPTIECRKARDGAKRSVYIVEGNPKDKHAIIVDDIDKTCGTKLACKNALSEAGADTVSSYSTHGVYPEESWRKMISAGFKHIWITDSCPTMAQGLRSAGPFEIISLAPEIERIIKT